MRLTNYSDYSLRVLLYLSLNSERLSTIKEIAESYRISKNHLMKVVHHLVLAGYVESVRGRSGGLRLAKDPSKINLGKVVRETEDDFKIVECFDSDTNTCRIADACKLKHILGEALFSFMKTLDKYTLQDLVSPQNKLKKSLELIEL
mgnify:CR=1 FL=1